MVKVENCEEPLDQAVEISARTFGGSFQWRTGKIKIPDGVRYE